MINDNDTRGVKSLDAATILAAPDLQVTFVEVPEWGGGVWIRELTGSERDRYEEGLISGRGKSRSLRLRDARARLVQLCVIAGPDPFDVETGEAKVPDPIEAKRLFNSTQVNALSQKSGKALDRIFEAIRILSGLKEADIEEAIDALGEMEESGSSG